MFAPSLLAPITIKSPRIEQFRSPVQLPNGTFTLSEQPEIRAEPSTMTGSRFPNPGYLLSSSSIDLTRFSRPLQPIPTPGRKSAIPTTLTQSPKKTSGGSMPGKTSTGEVRSRSSTGRTSSWDLDDMQPLLRMIGFNTNNYFGQQLKTDWNGFRCSTCAGPNSSICGISTSIT